jgi:hypothetical protein
MAARRSRRDLRQIVEHLRDTLTYDMAAKAYRCRFGKELDDAEYESFAEDLINEHYNAGLDEWDDDYLYYD